MTTPHSKQLPTTTYHVQWIYSTFYHGFWQKDVEKIETSPCGDSSIPSATVVYSWYVEAAGEDQASQLTNHITALCRICEPIAFTSIFPYIFYMVKSFGITNEREIAVYTGLVTSIFAIAEFSASIFWGWLSDRVGRKPILLTGLAGTGISMLMFGFAPNLPMALFARALGGFLNGYVAESVPS